MGSKNILSTLNAGNRIRINCELQFNRKTKEVTLAMSADNKKLARITRQSALSVAYSVYDELVKLIKRRGGTFNTSQRNFTTYMHRFLIDFGHKYDHKTVTISPQYDDFFFELYDVHNDGTYIVPFSSYSTNLPDILPVINPQEKEGGPLSRFLRSKKESLNMRLGKKASRIN